ncbi:hypothetical protein Awo_c06550 [Acetobacterium woodii DSM 1030]|uniref:Uncharacterized protein n=1 Tax=Acetobacterium woodii (strain ATCC 29683 / DSM 1030 / JCM 2381 / KCTC 1655 / WB1) TaxID=931626 RepID=H6LJP8_ACEWD|nr:hypothetical protein Awo_c06550 [Acetobacterium woodii DSM 1030]
MALDFFAYKLFSCSDIEIALLVSAIFAFLLVRDHAMRYICLNVQCLLLVFRKNSLGM